MENQTDLAKYKPTVDINQTFNVDETLPDNELTFDLFKKLKTARVIQDVTFIAIGRILKVIRDRKLYKFMDFENFSQFLSQDEISFSREKAYAYIRVYEIFVERLKLKQDELSELGVTRLMMLSPIIKGIENDDDAMAKIDESRGVRYNDFVRDVKSQTNLKGKPNVFWSEETEKYIVEYFDDKTSLISLGKFREEKNEN